MYIKQIIIQGFKSYKEQTVIEPFSPGTNVIVGRNGSGKSNFFAAIRFVLSDAYTQMSREERQALLHEGSGSAVMSAYVEIIFDNSDFRFHTEKEEVIIRRTISLKKDEYSIDRKVVSSKNEVFSMLDMAGFSRINPYYIVPQGRVTALTNMKESDRLKLLKEIAGTESYEARRTESLKIMNETISKREKIDELLKDVKERLKELEEEKEELRGFQSKDRERRCLEYAYYHREQENIAEALEEIEQARRGVEGSSESQQRFREGEAKIAQLEAQLQELQQSLELQRIEKQQLEEDRREVSRAQAQIELKVKGLADSQQAQDQARQEHDAQLKAVRAEIAAKEAELGEILPEYNKRRDKEAKVLQLKTAAESNRDRLLNKQSRSSRFKNKAERNAWLLNQVADLNERLGRHKATLIGTEEEIKATTATIKTLEAENASLRSDLDSWPGRQAELHTNLSKTRDRADRLNEERRVLRREEDALMSRSSNARAVREKAERKLSHVMDGDTSRGLATVSRLKRERNDLGGAYGMLADLMEVNDAYRIPVEQVAGTSLWNYVVDDRNTGTALIEALEKTKGGRLTMIPLAELRPRKVNLPRSSDVEPLISKIEYDPMYDKAFQQVFGKSVVCRSLAVATQYSRSHGVDAITIDGDTTTKRGTMTGGFVDPTRSRLLAVREAHRARDEDEKLLDELRAIRRQVELKNEEVTRALGEVRKLEEDLRRLQATYEPQKAELRRRDTQLEQARDRLETAMKRHAVIDKDMELFGTEISGYEAEMASEFKRALSAQEEEQLEEFAAQAQQHQKQFNDCFRRRGELEKRKQMLEMELRHSLRPRVDQITSQVFETTTAAAAGGSYAEAQAELKKAQKRAAQVEAQLRDNETEMEATANKIAKVEERKARVEEAQEDLAREIERLQKKLDKGLQRKAMLLESQAGCAKAIKDLGVLPEEAFEKYQRMDHKKIASRLKAVNAALKKFQHVNKKAFEQHSAFTKQQEELVKRRRELDASQQSIEELIDHLDDKKDAAIERTFRQVSKEFSETFEKLVPAGHGALVIQRRADRNRQQQLPPAEDSDEERQRQSVENYTGVGISVSFNSKDQDEQQKIQQLSGGQKSLCALCLIFAIQRTEVSPMVVFDEVDANLDAQYRTAVASLLEETSRENGTQFICTTFRPEIVHVADKCYGVTFTSKTSSIDCVPTESALNFVEGQQKR